MDFMGGAVEIVACDPSSLDARAMSDALWEEIQRRYGFTAPNPFEPGHFTGPVGGFWVAVNSEGKPVGSVAVTPLDPPAAELDVMYVAPQNRRAGVARLLLAAVESHARGAGIGVLRLRAGEPQPEALHFYAAAGSCRSHHPSANGSATTRRDASRSCWPSAARLPCREPP
jgi:GNAT superfamily N-acetyltransferase